MDPAVGRRWVPVKQFASEVYRHSMPVEAAGWREFAASPDFQMALRARLRDLGIGQASIRELKRRGAFARGLAGLAALDAGPRLLTSLHMAGGLPAARHRARLLRRLSDDAGTDPAERCWSATPFLRRFRKHEAVLLRGAVLVRVKGKRKGFHRAALTSDLAAAVEAPALNPARELLRALTRGSG